MGELLLINPLCKKHEQKISNDRRNNYKKEQVMRTKVETSSCKVEEHISLSLYNVVPLSKKKKSEPE